MTQQPFAGGGSVASGRPGQMTAVMRAMPQVTGPKVLRIGLVQGGKVIEERVIKQRTHVTIGPSEKSMFVVPSQSVPPKFRLFELIGNEYHLNFLDGMTGRVALADRHHRSRRAARPSQASPQGAYQVQLTEEARGKVVVGETTFLFQFVAPPPVQPRPQLPLAVKGGLASQIDWTLTIIAAFCFLLHFGMVGAMYSDWMDPVVDDEFNVAGLIDLVKNIPPPPPVEDSRRTPSDHRDGHGDRGGRSRRRRRRRRAARKGAGKGGSMSTGERGDSRAARSARDGDARRPQSQGPATAGVLTGGDVPTGALDDAAQSGAGVSARRSDGLESRRRRRRRRSPGHGGGGGLGGIGATTAGTRAAPAQAAEVQGPRATPTSAAPRSRAAASPTPTRRGGHAGGLPRLLQQGPREQSRICKGSVRVTAKIGPTARCFRRQPRAAADSADKSCQLRCAPRPERDVQSPRRRRRHDGDPGHVRSAEACDLGPHARQLDSASPGAASVGHRRAVSDVIGCFLGTRSNVKVPVQRSGVDAVGPG